MCHVHQRFFSSFSPSPPSLRSSPWPCTLVSSPSRQHGLFPPALRGVDPGRELRQCGLCCDHTGYKPTSPITVHMHVSVCVSVSVSVSVCVGVSVFMCACVC